MPKLIIEDTIIADSDGAKLIEGNHYFPPDSITEAGHKVLSLSETHTHCPWKGQASYYGYSANGHEYKDVVWFYPEPLPGAIERVGDFSGWVAGWREARVEV